MTAHDLFLVQSRCYTRNARQGIFLGLNYSHSGLPGGRFSEQTLFSKSWQLRRDRIRFVGLRYCARASRTGAGTAPAIARRRVANLPVVEASWDRVIRTTVGLRPHRDSGNVLRADKLDSIEDLSDGLGIPVFIKLQCAIQQCLDFGNTRQHGNIIARRRDGHTKRSGRPVD